MSVLGDGLHNTEIVIICVWEGGKTKSVKHEAHAAASLVQVGMMNKHCDCNAVIFRMYALTFKRGGSFIIILYHLRTTRSPKTTFYHKKKNTAV